jgi:hypothetical protein
MSFLQYCMGKVYRLCLRRRMTALMEGMDGPVDARGLHWVPQWDIGLWRPQNEPSGQHRTSIPSYRLWVYPRKTRMKRNSR